MAMTRKDYIVIADALLGARPRDREDLRSWRQWEQTADRIANALQWNYTNFDLDKFETYIKREATPG